MNDSPGFKFAIDRGGTFTDVWTQDPDGKVSVFKLLSEDPDNYEDAPFEAIRRVVSDYSNDKIQRKMKLDGSKIDWIRMGTTVATNALLERKGERFALLITKNFKDLLHIGNQSRPDLFDLRVRMPSLLYEVVIEVNERVILDKELDFPNTGKIVEGVNGEKLRVLVELNKEDVVRQLSSLKEQGIFNIAIVFAHSYAYGEHEALVSQWAKELGFKQISASHQIIPMIKMVPRGHTVCVDAYLTPSIQRYIHGFMSNFDPPPKNVLFMQSDGGLTQVHSFYGSRAILSGPAAGVIGYAFTTYGCLTDKPVIGFDMGGTSTDVSRYAGALEHLFESHIGPGGVAAVQSPQLDINTVAAGGGSQLTFTNGCFKVGPHSSGAHPGPACYRKGGTIPCVTDANLVLRRLLPQHFPHIFGPSENEPLDFEASVRALEKLKVEINKAQSGSKYSLEDVAMGFIDVANEAMCRPIRALTQAKGYDTSKHVLACFGGAGAQHACGIARKLGMKTVYVHRYAGILSAYGLALADVVTESQEPCFLTYNKENMDAIDNKINELEQKTRSNLHAQGFDMSVIEAEIFLHLRYDGTDNAIMCSNLDLQRFKKIYEINEKEEEVTSNSVCSRYSDFAQVFVLRYQHEFGFTLSDREIIVDDIRVRCTAKSGISVNVDDAKLQCDADDGREPESVLPLETVKTFFGDKYWDTSVYTFEQVTSHVGLVIHGPAIIIDKNSTIVVEPNCRARRTRTNDLEIEIDEADERSIGTELDPIQLSIFSHRFMSIAEQMGRVLQRTAISTNIKERLDFSCAIFGPDGGLVANAPHIPVHLGAMQHTVQYQMEALRKEGRCFQDGDVLLSNHPSTGGSHLPDLTVITPVFYKGREEPVFFVANRGHHADIGGTTPGSMPPNSKSIDEEGAVFKTFYLLKNGQFQCEELTEALHAPSRFPGCSGTRNLSDNISDLKAQVAANRKGIHLIRELIDAYGLDVVQAYMGHIQNNAEEAVRSMLKKMAKQLGAVQLHAEDGMDDGSEIHLRVQIDADKGDAIFDFNGTTPQVLGNTNCPPAVSRSCLLYCLRSLVSNVISPEGYDDMDENAMPLNQGCLRPVQIILPKGSFLNADEDAAVVGGNVLTSQRIVDVILRAFQAAAASQGCMNNTTFGKEGLGYYETVAGGAGAGPGWHGRSGIHTHMTNTRITDLEILERRYPVILRRFSLRPNSGGQGQFCGGDGVIRELWFREPLTLSVLTERRVLQPYGLKGGKAGKRGVNLLYRNYGVVDDDDAKVVNLGGKVTVTVSAGDMFQLCSPGGGGYGPCEEEDVTAPAADSGSHGSTEYRSRFMPHGSVFAYNRTQHSG